MGVLHPLRHDSSQSVYQRNGVSVVHDQNPLFSKVFRGVERRGNMRSLAMETVSLTSACFEAVDISERENTTATQCLIAFTGQE